MRRNQKNHGGSPCRSVFDFLSILTRKRACEQLQKFWEHEQASSRLNFASKSSKGKIMRTVKKFNGPFITPQIASHEKKGDLSQVMLKEIFHDSLKISKYCKDLYGKPFKGDWLARVVFPIQILLNFGGRCNSYF